jgi:hypothetical protein
MTPPLGHVRAVSDLPWQWRTGQDWRDLLESIALAAGRQFRVVRVVRDGGQHA